MAVRKAQTICGIFNLVWPDEYETGAKKTNSTLHI